MGDEVALEEQVEKAQNERQQKISKGQKLANEKYSDRVSACESLYRKTHGKSMPKEMQSTVALALENTVEGVHSELASRGVATENLTSSDLGNFTEYGFDVISAVISTTVLDEVASIQPMDNKTGLVFWLDAVYGSTVGQNAEGDDIFNAQGDDSGPIRNINDNGSFTSTLVESESFAIGDGTQTNFTGSAVYDPIETNTDLTRYDELLEIYDPSNDQTVVADSNGDLSGDGSGTVDFTTGDIDVTFDTAPDTDAEVVITYTTNFQRKPENTPEVTLDIREEAVVAKDRRVKANWLLESEYELQQHHGKQASEELSAIMSGIVRNEIDNMVLFEMLDNATAADSGAFDADPSSLNVSQNERNEDFINVAQANSDQIEDSVARGTGDTILASSNVASFIETLNDFEKRDGLEDRDLNGPHVRGEWAGFTIVKVPDYPDNEYVMVSTGNGWLDATYAWMPYMPLMMTRKNQVRNAQYERVLVTRNARRLLRPNGLVRGTVENI